MKWGINAIRQHWADAAAGKRKLPYKTAAEQVNVLLTEIDRLARTGIRDKA